MLPFLIHELNFCETLKNPGIDSEESILQAKLAWRAGTTNRVVVPTRRQAGNRFLCSQWSANIDDISLTRPRKQNWRLTLLIVRLRKNITGH
jgi:hypothetical protein